MSKLDEKVDNGANDPQDSTSAVVFPTVDGNFRYFFDADGFGALQQVEDNLVPQPANLM
jgi:hypothetical protein